MPFCRTARWERIIAVIAVVFVLIASIFMASSLVGLKSCVSEFDPDAHHDAGTNQERRWKQWLENLELVIDFEGITDPAEGPSKKRAALLAVGGAAIRELFATLTVADTQYSTAKAALTAHFTAKKNLTAERYKFFCTKPESPEESHDDWVTRLRVKGADCEFDKMDLESAITLVLTLHTYSEKLQREIIAQDMDLIRALSTARSIELTEKEIAFMKQNPLQSLATPVHAVRGFKQNTPLAPNLKVRLLNCAVIVGNECLTKANAKLWVPLATTARKETILLAFVKLRSRLSLSKWLILKISL